MSNAAHSLPSPARFNREKLDAIMLPIARAHGAEICGVEWGRDRNGWVLRIFVEKLGASEKRLSTEEAAVDLDLCSQLSRDLSPALDVAELVTHAYHLEVGSPGVERALRDPNDYLRFAGKKAKLLLTRDVAGQRVLTGTLATADADSVTIETPDHGGTSHMISLSDVKEAHLVFEFGPAPRPGKPGSSKKQKPKK